MEGFVSPHERAAPGSADECSVILLEWLSRRSLQNIFTLSSQWHALLQTELVNEAPHLEPLVSWPAVLDGPFEVKFITFVELCDPASLWSEGQELGHCVATYAEHCHSGSSLIFSLRDHQGKRLSTAEFRLDYASLGVYLVQHCALGNSEPDLNCIHAAKYLEVHLNHDERRPALVARRDFQQRKHEERAAQASLIGQRGRPSSQAGQALAWRLATGKPYPETQAGIALVRTELCP